MPAHHRLLQCLVFVVDPVKLWIQVTYTNAKAQPLSYSPIYRQYRGTYIFRWPMAPPFSLPGNYYYTSTAGRPASVSGAR